MHDTVLIIHPKPRTSAIIGTDIVCFPNYDNHSYAVTGFANSVFNWSVVNGAFFILAKMNNKGEAHAH